MGKVIIMRGQPGSGKSTYTAKHFPDALVCSADHFFMESGVCNCGFASDPLMTDHNPACDELKTTYVFDKTKISEAHAHCLQRFVRFVTTPVGERMNWFRESGAMSKWADNDNPIVVVDNTNINATEIAPYAALALAHGWELEIITLDVDPAISAARNVHDVPASTVKRMHKQMEYGAKNFPSWWNHKIIKES